MIKIKYSIIIPHYNNEDGLKVLLDSIPDRSDIQIIVVDDKSKKKPELNFDDIRISYLENDTDTKGAGKCRNIGLQVATGNYVIFADSDDFFTKDCFFDIDKLASDYDIIYFKPTSCFYEDKDRIANRHLKYSKLIDEYKVSGDKKILLKFHVPWSKVFKRSFVVDNEILFDEVIASNDLMFSLKSNWLARSIKVSDSKIYSVTIRQGSLMKQTNRQVRESRLEVAIRTAEYIVSNNIDMQIHSVTGLLWRNKEIITLSQLGKILRLFWGGGIKFTFFLKDKLT